MLSNSELKPLIDRIWKLVTNHKSNATEELWRDMFVGGEVSNRTMNNIALAFYDVCVTQRLCCHLVVDLFLKLRLRMENQKIASQPHRSFLIIFVNACRNQFSKDCDYDEEYTEAKESSLGNVRLMAELFNRGFYPESMLHGAIANLMVDKDRPKMGRVGMLVELLTHAGEALDRSEARDRVDGYFARLQEMAAALPDGHKVSALVRLRMTGWGTPQDPGLSHEEEAGSISSNSEEECLGEHSDTTLAQSNGQGPPSFASGSCLGHQSPRNPAASVGPPLSTTTPPPPSAPRDSRISAQVALLRVITGGGLFFPIPVKTLWREVARVDPAVGQFLAQRCGGPEGVARFADFVDWTLLSFPGPLADYFLSELDDAVLLRKRPSTASPCEATPAPQYLTPHAIPPPHSLALQHQTGSPPLLYPHYPMPPPPHFYPMPPPPAHPHFRPAPGPVQPPQAPCPLPEPHPPGLLPAPPPLAAPAAPPAMLYPIPGPMACFSSPFRLPSAVLPTTSPWPTQPQLAVTSPNPKAQLIPRPGLTHDLKDNRAAALGAVLRRAWPSLAPSLPSAPSPSPPDASTPSPPTPYVPPVESLATRLGFGPWSHAKAAVPKQMKERGQTSEPGGDDLREEQLKDEKEEVGMDSAGEWPAVQGERSSPSASVPSGSIDDEDSQTGSPPGSVLSREEWGSGPRDGSDCRGSPGRGPNGLQPGNLWDKEDSSNPFFTNLYIKDMKRCITEAEIFGLFGGIGPINSCMLNHDRLGRPFAYIAFRQHSDAVRAIQAFHDAEVAGITEGEQKLYVARHLWKHARAQEAQNLGKQPPALQLQLPKLHKNSCHPGNLLVQNLDMTIDDGALTIAFEKYGELLSVKVVMDYGPPAKSKGHGYVCFKDAGDARRAKLEMNGRLLGAKSLSVVETWKGST